MNILRSVMALAAAVMLLIAFFPMSQSYYATLRIVITTVAVVELLLHLRADLPDGKRVMGALAYIALALGFNPFVPLEITREIWLALDVLGILVFGWTVVICLTTPKEVEPVLEWRSNTKRKGLLYDPEIHGKPENETSAVKDTSPPSEPK